MDLVQWLPLVGGVGVGSVIGNYIGGGRARREVRGAVLQAIEATEMTRWAPTNYRDFRNAYRDVETTALIARIPRSAVRHYLVLAEAGQRLSDDSWVERDGEEDFGAGGIDGFFADVIHDGAELITRLAWRPWWTRLRLRKELRSLRDEAMKFGDEQPDIRSAIVRGQRTHGVLPGLLGQLPGINPELPAFPESNLNDIPELPDKG